MYVVNVGMSQADCGEMSKETMLIGQNGRGEKVKRDFCTTASQSNSGGNAGKITITYIRRGSDMLLDECGTC